MKKEVRLVANFDFRGPEGAKGREAQGMVRAGDEFTTDFHRAIYLQRKGMARTIKIDGPKINKDRLYGLEAMSIPEVLEFVNAEQITIDEAIELEKRGKARSTLIDKLEALK